MARYDPDRRGYRVFVGNLSSQTSHDNLAELFRPHGPIVDIWLASNPPGFGFVVFRNANDAEQAVQERNNTVYKGKSLKVQHARLFKDRSRRKTLGLSDEDTTESDRWTSESRSESRSRTRSRSRASSRSSRSRRRSRSRSLALSRIYRGSTSRSRTLSRTASRSRSRSRSTSSSVISRSRSTAKRSESSARSRRSREHQKRRHKVRHRRGRSSRRSGSTSASSRDDRARRSENSSSSAAPSRRSSSSAVRQNGRRRRTRCPHCHHCMSPPSSSSSSTSSRGTRRRSESPSASSGSRDSLAGAEGDRKLSQQTKNRHLLGRRRKSRSWDSSSLSASSSSSSSSSSSLGTSSSSSRPHQPKDIRPDLHHLQKSREPIPVRHATQQATPQSSLPLVTSQEAKRRDEKGEDPCRTPSCQSGSALSDQENLPAAGAGDGMTVSAVSDSEAEKNESTAEPPSYQRDVSATADFPSADLPPQTTRRSSSRGKRTCSTNRPVQSRASESRSKRSAGLVKIDDDKFDPQDHCSSPGAAFVRGDSVPTGNGDFLDLNPPLRSQPESLANDGEHEEEAVDSRAASHADDQVLGPVSTASLSGTTATRGKRKYLKREDPLQLQGTRSSQNEEPLTERGDKMETSKDIRSEPGETIDQNDMELQAEEPVPDAADKCPETSRGVSSVNILPSNSVSNNQEKENTSTEIVVHESSPVTGQDYPGKKMAAKSEYLGTSGQAEFSDSDENPSLASRRFSPHGSPRTTKRNVENREESHQNQLSCLKHKARENGIVDRRSETPSRKERTGKRLPSDNGDRKRNSGSHVPRRKSVPRPEYPDTASKPRAGCCTRASRGSSSAERQNGGKSSVPQNRGLSSQESACSRKAKHQNCPRTQEKEKSHLKDGRKRNIRDAEFSTLSCHSRQKSRGSQEKVAYPSDQSRHTSHPSECKGRHRQESTSSRCQWRHHIQGTRSLERNRPHQGHELTSAGSLWRQKNGRSSYQEGRSRYRSPLTWFARERLISRRPSRPSGYREGNQGTACLATSSPEKRPGRLKGFSSQPPPPRSRSLTDHRRNRSPDNRWTHERRNALTSERVKGSSSQGRQASSRRDRSEGLQAEARECRKRCREDPARKDRTSSSPPAEARNASKRLRKVSAQDGSETAALHPGAGLPETSTSPADRLGRKRLQSADASREQSKRRWTRSLDVPPVLKKQPATKPDEASKRRGIQENGRTQKVNTKAPAGGSGKPGLLPLPKPGLLPLPSNEPPQLQPSLLDVPTSCQAFLSSAKDLMPRSYGNDHVCSLKAGSILQTHSSRSCPNLQTALPLQKPPGILPEYGLSGESAAENLRGPLAGNGCRQLPACPRRTLLATPALKCLASVLQSDAPSPARADGSRAKPTGRGPSGLPSAARGPARTGQPTLTQRSRGSPTPRLHVARSRSPALTTIQESRLKSAILLVKNR